MPMKSLRSLRSSLRSLRSPLLYVEVMGVVEVMEVTLLFVEVTSLQKSKSLTDFSTIEFNFNNVLYGRTDTFIHIELSGDSQKV